MRESQQPIRESDLQRWRLIERFQSLLAEQRWASAGTTWDDPRRQLARSEYLGLFLFGLFNPVVKTMRGLCAASHLARVQAEVGGPVSLGSFSEAQAVVEPELLAAVFAQLRRETPPPSAPTGRPTMIIDSTVIHALPRMAWAFWRGNRGRESAVRLHVQFDLARDEVERGAITTAKTCERRQWRSWAKPGTCYIGDRYFSYDFHLLRQLQAKGVEFVVRLRKDAQWVEPQEDELSAADRAAGVTWSGHVTLGADGHGPRVRLVQILAEEETILLATTLPANEATPELIAVMYRHRWQVEMFFRWLKCILGCRHWLAESPRGVALQVYLALIAAQLLVAYTGNRPNRRQMEAIQFYLLGWATAEEVVSLANAGRTRTN